ncbi:hypothetical protein [Streptacidiphilus sp. MAP5-3]|uniref:hypothetical protein n=1 Tax=unclassified Streptacidiphilus TaxID=2643834 RepID=UPI003510ED40
MTTRQDTWIFHKALAPIQAEAEVRGWQQVAGRLQVPALHSVTPSSNREHVLAYEDVFASGRCQHLLGDLIASADRDPAALPLVVALIDAVCDDLIGSAASTGRTAALSDCVPALYLDRIRHAGRIDAWYLRPDLTIPGPGKGDKFPVRELRGFTLTLNGTEVPLDVPKAIRDARQALRPTSQWVSAITQGDPTEPNIAASATGACWLDFEHAGRNTLPGEIANLWWYLLAMGGWLVPTYQPDTYARTLALHLPPTAYPTLLQAQLSPQQRQLDLACTWTVGPGRHAALTRLHDRLTTDLGQAADLPPGRPLALLRPFLTTRILGVFPPSHFTDSDLLLLLAKLAEAQLVDGELFAHTQTPPDLTSPLE